MSFFDDEPQSEDSAPARPDRAQADIGIVCATEMELKPFVTTEAYERWRREFEHPKGMSVVTVIRGYTDHRGEGDCKKHSRPAWLGYCE